MGSRIVDVVIAGDAPHRVAVVDWQQPNIDGANNVAAWHPAHRALGPEMCAYREAADMSFDIGALTRGVIPIDSEPVLARFKLSLPSIAPDSIRARCGTIVKADPLMHSIELGPASAGSKHGPATATAHIRASAGSLRAL